jgi:hypothetical protein
VFVLWHAWLGALGHLQVSGVHVAQWGGKTTQCRSSGGWGGIGDGEEEAGTVSLCGR